MNKRSAFYSKACLIVRDYAINDLQSEWKKCTHRSNTVVSQHKRKSAQLPLCRRADIHEMKMSNARDIDEMFQQRKSKRTNKSAEKRVISGIVPISVIQKCNKDIIRLVVLLLLLLQWYFVYAHTLSHPFNIRSGGKKLWNDLWILAVLSLKFCR